MVSPEKIGFGVAGEDGFGVKGLWRKKRLEDEEEIDLVCKNLSSAEPSTARKHLLSNPALPTHNPTLSLAMEGRLHLPTHRSRLAPPFSPCCHGYTGKKWWIGAGVDEGEARGRDVNVVNEGFVIDLVSWSISGFEKNSNDVVNEGFVIDLVSWSISGFEKNSNDGHLARWEQTVSGASNWMGDDGGWRFLAREKMTFG
ncbi:hypothetical protein C1H46_035786 [Malus baccata]|uniref:Uncharacterized protein n=1 Tax=Malus baccata TaxID=106549 RepID=A0A540KWR9_MALBA|nr:hypothetical protein C1H46_035786 [Malus baccata]